MAFTLPQLLGWLRAEEVEFVVRRADGGPLPSTSAVPFTEVVFDSREARAGVLFCAVPGERTHGVHFLAAAFAKGATVALVEGTAPQIAGAEQLVVEVPGVRDALNAAARGWMALHAPRVVAITGSNGKTTTKDLTAAALRGSLRAMASPGNRNSGWGLPAAILGYEGDEDVLVLEMGASAPDEIARLCTVAAPWAGCITNVGPAHLEFFGDEHGVAKTKGALVEVLPSDGVAILNRDDAHFASFVARTRARVVSFGKDPHATLRLEKVRSTGQGIAFSVNGHDAELPMFGEHNAHNAAAAAGLAQALGVEIPVALDRMRQVQLSPHRSRRVVVGGRVLLDDSYNANPVSMVAALDSLLRHPAAVRRVAVLGDMAELGAHAASGHVRVIEHALANAGLHRVFLVGAQMARAAGKFDDARLVVHTTLDPARIASEILDSTKVGDLVLLKASRSAALERVLTSLEQACGEGPLAPGGQA